MAETLHVPWFPIVFGRALISWTPHLVAAALALFVLPSLVRWFQTWRALRSMPGPSDTVPFRFLLVIYWSRRMYINVDYATAELFNIIVGACELFKNKTFKIYNWMMPIVMIQTPEAAETLLNKPGNLSKPLMYTFLIPWLGEENVLTGTGEKWRLKRKLATPALHFKTLGNFMDVFNEHGNIMVDKMEEVSDKSEPASIYRYVQRCTLDITAELTTGVNPQTQIKENNVFGRCLSRMNYLICVRAFRPWLWPQWIYDKTAEGHLFKSTMEIMEKFSGKIVDDRKRLFGRINREVDESSANKNSTVRERHLALLDFMLEKHFYDKLFTVDEIKKDIDSVFFAANDTTSTALSWMMFLFGRHPDKQRKAQDEVDQILEDDPSRDFTLEDVKRMKYIDCCVKESLRLYPSVPLIGRVLDNDLVIDGHVVPKGVTCMVNIYSLHRNPKAFHKPEEFIPERFTTEEYTNRHPYSYIPFSGGPKNCLGQRFAITKIKILVAKMLHKYNFEAKTPIDKLRLTCEVIVRAKEGLHLSIKRREPGKAI